MMPQWHGRRKAKFRDEESRGGDSPLPHYHTRLRNCAMSGQDAERLAEVLAQCPALAHLNLGGNCIYGTAGTERLAGVLVRCRALDIHDLDYNNI
jgi:hypothetical protein